jgi:resuscitation-promoting factor RpfB
VTHPSPQDPWDETIGRSPPPPPAYGPPAAYPATGPPYPTAQAPRAASWNQQSRRRTLSRRSKIALASIGGAMLLCCGGLAVAVMTVPEAPEERNDIAATVAPTVAAVPGPSTLAPESLAPTDQATSSAAVTSRAAPSSAAAAVPVVVTRTVTETQKIAYQSRIVYDSSMLKGTRKVTTRGVAGIKTLTYQVTLTDGVQTAKKLVRSEITKAPVTEVVTIGTKTAPPCDPNYSGACVPIASDVDCAGGSGNGPAYVDGPVRVTGRDIYDLDRDGDGVGCDT